MYATIWIRRTEPNTSSSSRSLPSFTVSLSYARAQPSKGKKVGSV